MRKQSIIASTLVVALLVPVAVADPINPFDFNVYTIGDIGSSSSMYSSDFQGIAGVGGSAYFKGFSLHDVASAGPDTPYSLYAGGDVHITGQINNGGIEAGGSIYVNGAGIKGDINAGGSLFGTGGQIKGDVFLGGQDTTGNSVSVRGNVNAGSSFNPSFDLRSTSNYFLGLSDTIGSMTSTVTATNMWNELRVDVSSGLNVLELSSEELNSAWGVTISGPSDATVLINVTDDTVGFDSLVWAYKGGVSSDDTLLNLAKATDFDISGGNHAVNILAPMADTEFSHGLITGNLISGSLSGGGQVNAGGFTGDVPIIPEPSTILLLSSAAAIVLCRAQPRRS